MKFRTQNILFTFFLILISICVLSFDNRSTYLTKPNPIFEIEALEMPFEQFGDESKYLITDFEIEKLNSDKYKISVGYKAISSEKYGLTSHLFL